MTVSVVGDAKHERSAQELAEYNGNYACNSVLSFWDTDKRLELGSGLSLAYAPRRSSYDQPTATRVRVLILVDERGSTTAGCRKGVPTNLQLSTVIRSTCVRRADSSTENYWVTATSAPCKQTKSRLFHKQHGRHAHTEKKTHMTTPILSTNPLPSPTFQTTGERTTRTIHTYAQTKKKGHC